MLYCHWGTELSWPDPAGRAIRLSRRKCTSRKRHRLSMTIEVAYRDCIMNASVLFFSSRDLLAYTKASKCQTRGKSMLIHSGPH